MFRFAALFAVSLMASATAFAQDAPPATQVRPPRQLRFGPTPIEQAIASAVIRHLQGCWQSTADLGPDISVTVRFALNEDGSIDGAPRVMYPRPWAFSHAEREAVRRALEAVRRCDPFPLADDPELAAHYDAWRQQEVTFASPP